MTWQMTRQGVATHHDTGCDGYTSAAVRVGHNVAIADAQERDGDEPHRVEQVGMFLVMISSSTTTTLYLFHSTFDKHKGGWQHKQRLDDVKGINKNVSKRIERLYPTYRSHWRKVQLAMIHKETIKTRRTVPGQMVISVLRTNLVLKLMRLRAPIDRDDASVNSLLMK